MTAQVTVPGVPPELSDLLMWRDVKKTGVVCGVLLAILVFPTSYLIFRLFGFQSAPRPLICLILSGVVAIAVLNGWSIYAKTSGKVPPPLPEIFTQGLSETEAQKMAKDSLVYVNPALGLAGRALGGKDPIFAAKFVMGLLVVAFVFSFMSVMGLAAVVVVTAFTVPKLYELKKEDCDKLLGKGAEKYNEISGKISDIIFKKAKTN